MKAVSIDCTQSINKKLAAATVFINLMDERGRRIGEIRGKEAPLKSIRVLYEIHDGAICSASPPLAKEWH